MIPQYYNNAFDLTKLMGTISQKSNKKLTSFNYLRMKEKQLSKRRAKNKIARKTRRYNRLQASGKHCKFYKG
jgi:hypothetical protein